MRDLFLHVLNNYSIESEKPIANNALAGFIRNKFKEELSKYVPQERFIIKASPGQGNWTAVPWVATFDILVTQTAQTGYYPTFLFRSDMSGVYLNLNQGVTDIQNRYKARARDVLEIKAKDFTAQISDILEGFKTGPIKLGDNLPSAVSLYEHGSICSKFYDRDNFPSNGEIISDYLRIIKLYNKLVDNDVSTTAATENNDLKAQEYFENTKKRIKHSRIERNRTLVRAVKNLKGYKCEVCDFDFKKTYGTIGEGYIEAHHLFPLSQVLNEKVKIDPLKDFAVLCSNCHRMVHQLEDCSDIGQLKQIIERRRAS